MEKNILKKEKGTYKAPNDPVKNQLQFNKKDTPHKKNSAYLIDRLLSDLYRNLTFLINENQIRYHQSYINQLNHIKQVVLTDPRFKYQIVQNYIDNLYLRDNQIKGVRCDFMFNELQNDPQNFNPNAKGIF